jgi:hypothetical protein
MSTKQKTHSAPRPRYARTLRPNSNLRQRMSELISLRERVAQAELASHKLGVGDQETSNERHRQMKDHI